MYMYVCRMLLRSKLEIALWEIFSNTWHQGYLAN